MQAAAPGLLASLRDQPGLRDVLWHTFTTDAVTVYADQLAGSVEDAAAEAKAVIVLAAGAALFASVLAGADNTPALQHRLEAILLAGSRRTAGPPGASNRAG